MSNTNQRDPPGNNDTSLNYMAAGWRLRSSFSLQMTDPGSRMHHAPHLPVFPLFPPSVKLPTDESCQVPPQEKRVCLSKSECLRVCFHFDGNVGSNVSNGR